MLKMLADFLADYQSIFFIYFILVNGLYSLFVFMSLRTVRRYSTAITTQSIRDMMESNAFFRPLSIAVPAYNEESTIVSNVKSMLNLSYPEHEVIVVNDGSKDDTLGKLVKEFKLIKIDKPLQLSIDHKPIKGVYYSLEDPQLLVIDKENGGKADALNAGINASKYPLFCCVDADSLLESESLLKVVRPFIEDKEVIATGGVVKVVNGCRVEKGRVEEVKAPSKPIECYQAVEYIRSFLSGRIAWSMFNSLLIISGAFSIFRKDMLLSIGGYRHTVGEDMDLVLRLHIYCKDNGIRYKVRLLPDPVCWTQAPFDYRSLLKQRNRWQRGLIDSLWYNRKLFLNLKYGMVGLIGFPYFLFIEAAGPVIELVGVFIFAAFYLSGVLSAKISLGFIILAILWGIWINLGSILLDSLVSMRYRRLRDILLLSLSGFVEFMGPRQIVVATRLIATFQVWKKTWGKPDRHAIDNNDKPNDTAQENSQVG